MIIMNIEILLNRKKIHRIPVYSLACTQKRVIYSQKISTKQYDGRVLGIKMINL